MQTLGSWLRLQVSAEQVQQLQDMFPGLERDIILSVLQANHGDVDRALSALLQLAG